MEIQKWYAQLVINNLTVENFRGFRTQTKIEFDKQLTVFIGENGAGKTSLLDALVKMLSQVIVTLKPSSKEEYSKLFDENDLNNETILDVDSAYCNLETHLLVEINQESETNEIITEEFEREYEDQTEAFIDSTISWTIPIVPNEVNMISEDENFDKLNNFKRTVDFRYIRKLSLTIPVIVYYQLKDAEISSKISSEKLQKYTIFETYHQALKKNSLSFSDFSVWFKWQSNIELSKGNNVLLQQVKTAIYDLLNDGIEQTYTGMEVLWENYPEGKMIMQKNGKQIYLDQLSSGEKTLLCLVANLAYRLALANPNSENPLINGTGIVIIDEIDLHLHPKWQQKVLPKLLSIFPKCQFIVSTHSPLVLANVSKECVRFLKDKALQVSPYTKGRDVNSITEDVFGVQTRPIKYKEDIAKFYELLQTNIDEAKELLVELKQNFGDADTEIVRAESYLELY
jgi:predicted ATP-binding protein involved in virulence